MLSLASELGRMSDIVWPADADRRQALVLVVPLVLPALVNLAFPYRLTPDWTFPKLGGAPDRSLRVAAPPR